jgi:carnitine-CoA ligase
VPGALDPVPFAERTIPSVLTRLAAAWADKTALSFTETGVRFSYAELEREVARGADAVARAGGGAGAVTAVLLENCPELFLAWWGSAWAGGLTCMLNPELSGDQLSACLELAAPSVVVTGVRQLATLAPVLAGLAEPPSVLLVGADAGTAARHGASSWEHALATARPRPAVPLAPGDPFTLMFTSGSTGLPKCVLHSHHYALVFADTAVVSQQLTAADRSYECRPCFHVAAAYSVVLATLLTGGDVCVGPRFSASTFWPTLAQTGATRVALIGAMANILYRRPPGEWDRRHSVRYLRAGPLPAEPRAFEERFGVHLLLPGWGSTEVWPLAPDFDERAGDQPDNYVGRAVPHMRIRVADPAGLPVESDGQQVGELLVRPDQPLSMMTRYYRDAEATVAAWRDLWYHTGDLATIDADGRVFWQGRTADVVRRRGENVSCALIERTALKLAGIAECAAYGVASSLGEEDVKLDVVLAPGAGGLRPAGVAEHLERELPAFMVPRYIEIREQLPKTATHRVIKSRLRGQPISAGTLDRETSRP